MPLSHSSVIDFPLWAVGSLSTGVIMSVNTHIRSQTPPRSGHGRYAMPFGEVLRTLRLRAGFGLRRFADLIDMKPSNLSAIENGQRLAPRDKDKLQTIAGVLVLAEGSEDRTHFFDAARQAE